MKQHKDSCMNICSCGLFCKQANDSFVSQQKWLQVQKKLTDYVYLPKTAYQSIIKPVSAPSPISGTNDPCNVSAFPMDVFLSVRRYLAWYAHPDTDDLFVKSFHEEHDLCVKSSGTTGRLGPPLLFPYKIKKKCQSSFEMVCVFNKNLTYELGCTYGRKIKQLTFFCQRALSLELCN